MQDLQNEIDSASPRWVTYAVPIWCLTGSPDLVASCSYRTSVNALFRLVRLHQTQL